MSKPIRELNLELGRPDAAEALRRLAAHRLPHLAAAAGAVLFARGGIHYIQ